jgi:hypothetical protein
MREKPGSELSVALDWEYVAEGVGALLGIGRLFKPRSGDVL